MKRVDLLSSMEKVNISVIIPVYNAEKYLEKAVKSALKFDVVTEVILVEDRSPDNAYQICKDLASSNDRVKLYTHPNNENRGAGASRNLGLEKAIGNYIAFLDADDFYLPNRFDYEYEIFKNPEVDGVYGATGVHFYNEIGKENFLEKFNLSTPSDIDTYLTTVKKKIRPEDLFNHLWGIKTEFIGHFHLNALTIKKDSIDKWKLRFNERLRLHQDSEFIGKLAFKLKLFTGNYKEAVAIRGVHDENRYVNKTDNREVLRRKLLLYEEFLLWLSENGAKRETLDFFEITKDYFDFKLSDYPTRKKKYLSYIGKHENFLKSFEFPYNQIHGGVFSNYIIQKIYLKILFIYRKVLK